jgi:hypothetical protein
MKGLNNYSFFVSIIIYIIYEKIYYILCMLDEILLLKLNFSSEAYFLGFIVSALLTSISVVFLYRIFIMDKIINRKAAMYCSKLLILILFISFGTSKYLSVIAAKDSNNDIFLKQIANYDYINLIFFILTFVLLVFFFIRNVIINKKQ